MPQQLELVRRWAWLVVLCTIVGWAVAFLVASQIPRTYSSQVSILVGPPLGGIVSNEDIQVGQSLRQTYADLAGTRPLLGRVIQAAGANTTADDLGGNVATRVPSGSNVFFVSVTDHDGKMAAALANAVADELAKYSATNPDPKASPNVVLTVVDPAVPSTTPSSRGPAWSALFGAVIGFVLAVLVVGLVETLRRPARTSEESSVKT